MSLFKKVVIFPLNVFWGYFLSFPSFELFNHISFLRKTYAVAKVKPGQSLRPNSNSTTPLSAYFLFDRIDLDVNALLAFLLDKTNKWATDNLLLIKKTFAIYQEFGLGSYHY